MSTATKIEKQATELHRLYVAWVAAATVSRDAYKDYDDAEAAFVVAALSAARWTACEYEFHLKAGSTAWLSEAFSHWRDLPLNKSPGVRLVVYSVGEVYLKFRNAKTLFRFASLRLGLSRDRIKALYEGHSTWRYLENEYARLGIAEALKGRKR